MVCMTLTMKRMESKLGQRQLVVVEVGLQQVEPRTRAVAAEWHVGLSFRSGGRRMRLVILLGYCLLEVQPLAKLPEGYRWSWQSRERKEENAECSDE
mmetsp:Transcript_81046/g.161636  ORF Transcript_81046/g.161636 Transcript_81046/m.161636 type:complete len:97 (+) Transcript_81046:676-966(+)